MDYNTLRRWRFTVPFFIATGCLLPWFLLTFSDLQRVQVLNQLIIPPLAWIATFFYVGLDLRGPYWQREINAHLSPQILAALLGLIPDDLNVSSGERGDLQRNVLGRLTGIFWEAIDRDQTLRPQKRHFYSNGIIYSTSIDVYLLCSIGGIGYAVATSVTRDYRFLIVSAGLFLIAISSKYFVLPRVRRRHQVLSEEQIDLLRRSQADFVRQRFRKIIAERRHIAGTAEPEGQTLE